MEFFSTESVTVQGARRNDAIEEFLNSRIKLLLRIIDGIEMETVSYSVNIKYLF